jgi:tRNA pseudouridine32 synthase/23S rRNA pseudouridine746 synthase
MSVRVPQRKPTSPLPTKHGVGASCVALPQGAWPTIAAFLQERFPAVSAETWRERMAAGEVVDEAGERVTEERAYRPNLRIYYYRALAWEPVLPVEERVIFQDEQLVVADKPHFLPVVPSGRYVQETLLARLKRKLQLDTLTPVHRLDRETAGVVVFCVQPAMRGAYQDLFRLRRVHKEYEAIVHFPSELEVPETYRSRLDEDQHFMRMREVEGTPNTETHLRLIEARGAFARLSLAPVTGRKHQLRVHCAALRMPIVNDHFYPELQAEGDDDYARPLQLLAKSITFQDPISGRQRNFASDRLLQVPPRAGT